MFATTKKDDENFASAVLSCVQKTAKERKLAYAKIDDFEHSGSLNEDESDSQDDRTRERNVSEEG